MNSTSSYAQTRRSDQYDLWKERRPLLGQLTIELTERCNNDCIHCCINLPADDAQAQSRELTAGEWGDILRQAAELGALDLLITGGEPLLRPDFPDIYLMARRLGLRVTLNTNACLVTPEIADLLARVPPRHGVSVTAYGMRPESYERVTRRPGSFAEFRRGLSLLLERRVHVGIRSAVLPPNREEMDEFEAWAETIADQDEPPGYVIHYQLRNRRDSPAKNRQIERLRLTTDEELRVHLRHEARYLRSMNEFCQKFVGPTGDVLFSCGAGHGGCVDAYGMLQPCMALRDPVLAVDLRAHSLRHALEDVFPRLGELCATDPEYLARCAPCFLKGLCEQCPAMSWMEHGQLDKPVEYYCRVAHAKARYLGLLADGEHGWEVADWRERIEQMAKGVERE